KSATARSSIFALRRSAARDGVAAPASKKTINAIIGTLNFYPATFAAMYHKSWATILVTSAFSPRRVSQHFSTPPVNFFSLLLLELADRRSIAVDCGYGNQRQI